jgi:hypothetical protein
MPRKKGEVDGGSAAFDFSKQEKASWRKWKYDDPKFDCADWTPEVAKKRSVSLWVLLFIMKRWIES